MKVYCVVDGKIEKEKPQNMDLNAAISKQIKSRQTIEINTFEEYFLQNQTLHTTYNAIRKRFAFSYS